MTDSMVIMRGFLVVSGLRGSSYRPRSAATGRRVAAATAPTEGMLGCNGLVGGAMSTIEDSKALVRRFYAEIDAGNLDAMDDLLTWTGRGLHEGRPD